MRAATVAVITGAALLLGSPPSPAQPRPAKAPPAPTASTPDPSAEARAHFNQGVTFAKKGEWPKAYAAFLEAWKLKTHPQIALNLGRAEMEIGKYRDSIAHLHYHLEHAEAGDPDMPTSRRWLTESEKKVARLEITVDVAGSEVLVDGVLEGKAPLSGRVLVDPGAHRVEVVRGTAREARTVEVAQGASVRVSFGAAEPEPEPALPAERVVLVDAPVEWRTAALISGGALSVAGLAMGGVFLGLSLDRGAAADAAARDPSGRDAMVKAAEDEASFRSAMVWGFAGAGVALAGTAAVFFLVPKSKKGQVQGAVGFGARGPSLSIQGAF